MPELKSIRVGSVCFKNVSELKLIGMKMLESVIVGENCFTKKKSENDKNVYGLYVKNCESLRELKIGNHSFEEYSVCEIENVPSLEVIEVGSECFMNVNELKLIGMKMLKKVLIGENCFTKKKSENDKSAYGLYVKNCESLRELKIGNYSFSDYSVCEIESVVSLEVIEVGNECFENVNELKLIGMKGLERVLIGQNSFTKHKNGYSRFIDRNRHFHLKNCERVRELKIGCFSFSDYSVCEIENVPSLEVIEMGDVNKESNNFYSASKLELKSDCSKMRMMSRFA